MNSNHNNNRQDLEDEISLQELFLALWRRKILIIVMTIVSALFAGIFSMFAIRPVYHSRLNIVINMPKTYTSKYGDYTLALTSNEQYINLITSNDILRNTINDMGYKIEDMTIDSIRDRITISQIDNKNNEQNSFYIKVASDNPQEAKILAQTLYDNFIKFLDIMINESAMEYFLGYFSVQEQSLQVELETNQVLLDKTYALTQATPMTISQKELMDALESYDDYSDYIIMDNIINPNYTQLELDIIEIKQTINTRENLSKLYNEYVRELEEKLSTIKKYSKTGDYQDFEGDIINITKGNIYLPSEPIAPSRKSSPSNLRYVIIGGLLGGMVAVLISLIKEYWFRDDQSL